MLLINKNEILMVAAEINCPDLPDIVNGRVVLSGTSVGSRAMYSCVSGFGLVGISPRICQLNGQWSAAEPSCQREFDKFSVYRLSKQLAGFLCRYSCLLP